MAVEVVCEICGIGNYPHLIVNCIQCNSYQHRYCMQVVAYAIGHEWHCYECQDKAIRDPELRKDVSMASQEHSSMTDSGNHPVDEEVEDKEQTQSLEAEAPVPDTSGDEELARKLFVEYNRVLLGIPGDGGLVILDPDNYDDVPAETEAPPALEAEAPVPDTFGDEELARKLFVECNRDLIGIPGDGGLVILDDDDDVPAETQAEPAADGGVPGSSSRKKVPKQRRRRRCQ